MIVYSYHDTITYLWGPSWLWWYGSTSWIYRYIWNQYLSPLTWWVRITLTARCTRYNIKFVNNLRQIGGFLRVLQFPPPINWPPPYNWNIVESDVKHHYPYPTGKIFEYSLWWKSIRIMKIFDVIAHQFCNRCSNLYSSVTWGVFFYSIMISNSCHQSV